MGLVFLLVVRCFLQPAQYSDCCRLFLGSFQELLQSPSGSCHLQISQQEVPVDQVPASWIPNPSPTPPQGSSAAQAGEAKGSSSAQLFNDSFVVVKLMKVKSPGLQSKSIYPYNRCHAKTSCACFVCSSCQQSSNLMRRTQI